ncbi:hypothetical protein MPL3356_340075 [Mesorhizobium plurifarium]|uniref:Uncharacterized protein n=1 Tax=Mesorhizobium plurifarium TaxID=69974 RepID=A0A090DVA2_MESPL|nr:hypothetical protein MPL3356_340075 [Mesorhizobium plurifarium]
MGEDHILNGGSPRVDIEDLLLTPTRPSNGDQLLQGAVNVRGNERLRPTNTNAQTKKAYKAVHPAATAHR